MHTAQSMHSSGSITSMLGPSRKQSTGQTSTQSVYLQRIHCSVTTWVIAVAGLGGKPSILFGFGSTHSCEASGALPAFLGSTNEHGSRSLVAGSVDEHQGAQGARTCMEQRGQRLLQGQFDVADAVRL